MDQITPSEYEWKQAAVRITLTREHMETMGHFRRRSWLERLFTWPWRPWIDEEFVTDPVLAALAKRKAQKALERAKAYSERIKGNAV